MFVDGPHSPIGRGSGLKIRQVSVRVRLGARLQPPEAAQPALSVVLSRSQCAVIGQRRPQLHLGPARFGWPNAFTVS